MCVYHRELFKKKKERRGKEKCDSVFFPDGKSVSCSLSPRLLQNRSVGESPRVYPDQVCDSVSASPHSVELTETLIARVISWRTVGVEKKIPLRGGPSKKNPERDPTPLPGKGPKREAPTLSFLDLYNCVCVKNYHCVAVSHHQSSSSSSSWTPTTCPLHGRRLLCVLYMWRSSKKETVSPLLLRRRLRHPPLSNALVVRRRPKSTIDRAAQFQRAKEEQERNETNWRKNVRRCSPNLSPPPLVPSPKKTKKDREGVLYIKEKERCLYIPYYYGCYTVRFARPRLLWREESASEEGGQRDWNTIGPLHGPEDGTKLRNSSLPEYAEGSGEKRKKKIILSCEGLVMMWFYFGRSIQNELVCLLTWYNLRS